MRGTEGAANSAGPPFEIHVNDDGAEVRVTALGELDIETSPQLDATLRRAEAPGRNVTVDLRRLTFMDSTGINLLVAHASRAESERFTFSIWAPEGAAGRVLDLAGVRRMLPIVDRPPPVSGARLG